MKASLFVLQIIPNVFLIFAKVNKWRHFSNPGLFAYTIAGRNLQAGLGQNRQKTPQPHS